MYQLPKLTKKQKEYLYIFDNDDYENINEEEINKILQLMIFYIKKINCNNRYNSSINNLINKLKTAKKKETKKQLKELEDIYGISNKLIILSAHISSSNDLINKNPIYGGEKDIDFQISLLERAKKDKDLKEENYIIENEEDGVYYTLLDNLKHKYKVNYKVRDVLLIALSHIYCVFKGKVEDPLNVSKNYLKGFITTFIKLKKNSNDFVVDLNNIKINVYSISSDEMPFPFEVSNIYLEDCEKYYWDFEEEPFLILDSYYDWYQKKWIKGYLFFGKFKGGRKKYKCFNYDSDKYFR